MSRTATNPSRCGRRWAFTLLVSALACTDTPEPQTAAAPRGDRRAPPKPGDSITRTMMCSCASCQPAECCREMEKDAPPIDKGCADGYDFSKCKTPVQSCESRCFQQRWRVLIEVGCEAARPRSCCHATADF